MSILKQLLKAKDKMDKLKEDFILHPCHVQGCENPYSIPTYMKVCYVHNLTNVSIVETCFYMCIPHRNMYNKIILEETPQDKPIPWNRWQNKYHGKDAVV